MEIKKVITMHYNVITNLGYFKAYRLTQIDGMIDTEKIPFSLKELITKMKSKESKLKYLFMMVDKNQTVIHNLICEKKYYDKAMIIVIYFSAYLHNEHRDNILFIFLPYY